MRTAFGNSDVYASTRNRTTKLVNNLGGRAHRHMPLPVHNRDTGAWQRLVHGLGGGLEERRGLASEE